MSAPLSSLPRSDDDFCNILFFSFTNTSRRVVSMEWKTSGKKGDQWTDKDQKLRNGRGEWGDRLARMDEKGHFAMLILVH